jgi:hypothetical protein
MTGAAAHESNLREWLEHTPAAAEHRDLVMLWVSLSDIVGHGGAEREFCRDLLDLIARFVKRRSGDSGNFGF